MPDSADQRIGKIIGKKIQERTLALLQEDPRTSLEGFRNKLVELLEAEFMRVKLDAGKWKYSKRLKDNSTQLRALTLLAEVLGLRGYNFRVEPGEDTNVEFIIKVSDDSKKKKKKATNGRKRKKD